MALKQGTRDQATSASQGDGSVSRIRWDQLANTDTGSPVSLPEWADRTVHAGCNRVDGTTATVFGAGGSVSLEGSNDYDPAVAGNAGTWIVLTDQNGVAMTYTAASLKQMTEAPLWVRPRVTAGDGSTNINVVLVVRRSQPMIAR